MQSGDDFFLSFQVGPGPVPDHQGDGWATALFRDDDQQHEEEGEAEPRPALLFSSRCCPGPSRRRQVRADCPVRVRQNHREGECGDRYENILTPV